MPRPQDAYDDLVKKLGKDTLGIKVNIPHQASGGLGFTIDSGNLLRFNAAF